MAAVACAIVVALVTLAGCAAAPAPAPTTVTPTTAPVFASDEEALAAATEAYANYLKAHDTFWADDESSPDEFLGLSTGSAREGDAATIDEWKAEGWRAVGVTTFDSIRLQRSETTDGVYQIGTYLCLDVSKGDVLDAKGTSVAKLDRPLRLPLEVEFEATTATPTELKISRSEVWSGENFC